MQRLSRYHNTNESQLLRLEDKIAGNAKQSTNFTSGQNNHPSTNTNQPTNAWVGKQLRNAQKGSNFT